MQQGEAAMNEVPRNSVDQRSQVSKRALRARRSPVVFINTTQEEAEQFQEIVAIDDIDYLTQAIALTALFNGAIDNTSGRFIPGKARELIANYNESLDVNSQPYKIGIFNTHQTTLTQQNSAVSAMINQILETLKRVMGVALGASSVAQMTAAVTDAFTNLDEQSGDAWIFWEKKVGNKTTYSYAILFAFQDSTTGKLMFALPMSLEISVDVSYERVLFITVEDKETYSVKLDTMKVGQLLFPKSPGANALQTARRLGTRSGSAGVLTEPSPVTNIVVTNWAKTTTFANAATGFYTDNHPLVQLMAIKPNVVNPLYDGNQYLVSFTLNGVQETRGLLLNGTLPDAELWFVSL
jgi:hypothetical protein